MILNAALVAGAIMFALRVVGRSTPDTFGILEAGLQWKDSPPPGRTMTAFGGDRSLAPRK